MNPESLMTQGLIAGRGGGGGGLAPEPSCLELAEVGPTWITFTVIPDPGGTDYSGTNILYGAVASCSYSQKGPEDVQDNITITGLTLGTIYVFVPVAYGPGGARAKPGNAILATVPVNIVDMPSLELNSCSLEDIWAQLGQKVGRSELTTALQDLDAGISNVIIGRSSLLQRMRRLEAEIVMLRGKV